MIKTVLPAKGTMTYIRQWDECWNINLAAMTCAMSEDGREDSTEHCTEGTIHALQTCHLGPGLVQPT